MGRNVSGDLCRGRSIQKEAVGGGEWRMEDGEWRMENGKWKMENGEWKKFENIVGADLCVRPFPKRCRAWGRENGDRRKEKGKRKKEKRDLKMGGFENLKNNTP